MGALAVPEIRLEGLTLAYDRHPAVHHLSGSFVPGSLTAVVGPNGAGKSTLLKALAGLIKPAEGRVTLSSLQQRDIAYLPQQADVDGSVPLSVLEVVALGHWRRMGLFGGLRGDDIEAASGALSAVGLAGFETRAIGTLSAGQFQRALFARMMLQNAKVILLDEPFTAIDARTTADLLDLVRRWHDEKRTVVTVLHDYDQVRRNFPETLLLARELVAWGPTEDTLSAGNLLKARAMAESWRDDALVCRRPAA
ncbi:MAG: metal ABC transporter ATP-binding protein [Alphaproteobacteria bacterium]|nr:metal ABC transporter ATP-binding protein [Alphaproteobacteria bacterium]